MGLLSAFPNSRFDAHSEIYAQLQITLKRAIKNLSAESVIEFRYVDFLCQGDIIHRIAAAHTLEVRLYLQTGYEGAYFPVLLESRFDSVIPKTVPFVSNRYRS